MSIIAAEVARGKRKLKNVARFAQMYRYFAAESVMQIRYYLDPDTDEPHIYGHGIMEDEVEHVLRGPGEELPGKRNSRMKLGRTVAGRYLQVIFVRDEESEGLFVITAYELRGKAKKAFRRRNRRKPR